MSVREIVGLARLMLALRDGLRRACRYLQQALKLPVEFAAEFAVWALLRL